MAINSLSLKKAVFLILFSFICGGCKAGEDTPNIDILEHISRKVLLASSEYGRRIKYCDNLVLNSKLPLVDDVWLSTTKEKRMQAITAISYLSFHNYFLCEKDALLMLSYHIGIMESLNSNVNAKYDMKAHAGVRDLMVFPSQQEIELEIQYLALPIDVKNYFESVIGLSPFDLIKTLEKNKLIIF